RRPPRTPLSPYTPLFRSASSQVILCALLGGIVWNLITWWFGLPSSSSHALIGGLCGAALAAASNDWGALIWSETVGDWTKNKGDRKSTRLNSSHVKRSYAVFCL